MFDLVLPILLSSLGDLIRIAIRSIKNSPRYAIFTLIQHLVLIPLTLLAAFIIALLDEFPSYDGISVEPISSVVIGCMMLFAVGIVFVHMLSFNPNYREFVQRVGLPVIDASELGMPLSDYHSYLVNTAHSVIVLGTIFGAILWYMCPSKERLEPLTVILASEAALIGYLRTRYHIGNPFDRMFGLVDSDVQGETEAQSG